MSYLIDTNVLSELRPGKPQPDPQVLKWAARVGISQQFVAAVSLAEIETGILRLEQRTPPQGQALRRWFDALALLFRERTLNIDAQVAHHYARLQARQPRPINDAWIAATACAHGLIIVTRNIRDFDGCGVETLNPWLG